MPSSPSPAGLRRGVWIDAGLMAMLILLELLTVDAALSWAAGGLLGLPDAVSWAVAAAGAALSLWLVWRLFRLALASEAAGTTG
jgi:hypothetical protein